MLKSIFGSIGSSVGKSFGGGILSTIGRFAGRALGSYLEHLNYEPEEYHHFRNIHEKFILTTAKPGEPIPLVFGTVRVSSKIIWASQIKEAQNTTDISKYFPGAKDIKSIHHTTQCSYYLSFAASLCEGEISGIGRVWANDELITLEKYKVRLYTGSEAQLPDPLIMASYGPNKTPAFRGLCYIVFEDLPLEDFGHSIPNFSFEVIRRPNVLSATIQPCVEEMVTAINIIPGSGEFVYDTIVQYKTTTAHFGGVISTKPINAHNYHNIADSLYNLNQLQTTCPNIKWTAPVVCWFADSLDGVQCTIKPTVEFNDELTKYSAEWQVGKYSRATAKLVSRDEKGNPKYGGTVNDASLIRYLHELKRRTFKIMFYPMFFLDIPQKPWRGHVTTTPDKVHEFFNKEDGYNNFILHYAHLVKNYADCFVIGSELVGLTKIRDSNNNFPAIDELIKLAKAVKEILGPNVLITYAADWSEYHHTEGGWYHLDKLFASPYIDFVGIDCYFPVTNTTNSKILSKEIVQGFNKGEGYDYYLDHNGNKQSLKPEYAWKNIKYWWENNHINPDGQQTEWQPKMKKIWFTEFGFPSIDKATNQPNVFFDPLCCDGGVPRYSSGTPDFLLQRRSIKSFIEYWQSQEYIEQIFLWTWETLGPTLLGLIVAYGAMVIYGRKDTLLIINSAPQVLRVSFLNYRRGVVYP